MKKPVYQDKPRFELPLKYEESMKRLYSTTIVNMVRAIGIKMNSMVDDGK